jgi:hypothetical protein
MIFFHSTIRVANEKGGKVMYLCKIIEPPPVQFSALVR